MPLVQEMRHTRSLNFRNERRVIILRGIGLSFPRIAGKVWNREGNHPPVRTVADVYYNFSKNMDRRKYKYKKCGRKPWKLTKDVQAFLVRRLLLLRKTRPCTSTMLQQALAAEKGIHVAATAIRKCLRKRGYKWLPRCQKRKYSREDRKKRRQFARQRKKRHMCMDGIILARPSADPTARENFCRSSETHMWRKPSEHNRPELAGDDPMSTQFPLDRAVPFWGGIGPDGAAIICFHKGKKIKKEEWVEEVRNGNFKTALSTVCRVKPDGDSTVLCDNEGFLDSVASKNALRAVGVKLWHTPPRSPDCNPIERFWSWVRKEMRARDLNDFIAKRPILGSMAYKQRLRCLLKSPAAQSVAKKHFHSFRETCKKVLKCKGAASGC